MNENMPVGQSKESRQDRIIVSLSIEEKYVFIHIDKKSSRAQFSGGKEAQRVGMPRKPMKYTRQVSN